MAITTEQELRGLYGAVSQRAAIKMIDHLDTHCRRFIAASPFMLLATSNGVSLDVSPKGDPAGCVVIGEGGTEMLLADRPGNNRIDGLLNIVRHPHVSCLFLIPGVNETLRVQGRASIHNDAEVLERCAVKGRLPITVTRIAVDQAGLHCAKAFMRSGLWKPETWHAERPVPTMGAMLVDHCGTTDGFEDEAEQERRQAAALY